jgi:NAD-dependent deacetylase
VRFIVFGRSLKTLMDSTETPYIQAPIYVAKSAEKVTVEINPSETSVSHVVDYRLAMPAGLALDEIWKRY